MNLILVLKKNKFWGLHNEQSKLRKQEITKNYFVQLMDSVESKYAHDFDKIDQTNCDYGKEKVRKNFFNRFNHRLHRLPIHSTWIA